MDKVEIVERHFNNETAIETVVFRWPNDRVQSFHYTLRYPDAKEMLAQLACYVVGRAADKDRCRGVTQVRLGPGGLPELTLEFDPPWWLPNYRKYVQAPDFSGEPCDQTA